MLNYSIIQKPVNTKTVCILLIVIIVHMAYQTMCYIYKNCECHNPLRKFISYKRNNNEDTIEIYAYRACGRLLQIKRLFKVRNWHNVKKTNPLSII